MLNDGVVEPSNFTWALPVLSLEMKDGKFRFVVDYRQAPTYV